MCSHFDRQFQIENHLIEILLKTIHLTNLSFSLSSFSWLAWLKIGCWRLHQACPHSQWFFSRHNSFSCLPGVFGLCIQQRNLRQQRKVFGLNINVQGPHWFSPMEERVKPSVAVNSQTNQALWSVPQTRVNKKNNKPPSLAAEKSLILHQSIIYHKKQKL